MKSLFSFIFLALIAFCMSSCNSTPEKPNVVVIFCDDLGYGDINCFSGTKYQTPNLDQMADDGMRFTDFCVAAYVCSPSRGALLTGRYPQRFPSSGVFFPWSKNGIPNVGI